MADTNKEQHLSTDQQNSKAPENSQSNSSKKKKNNKKKQSNQIHNQQNNQESHEQQEEEQKVAAVEEQKVAQIEQPKVEIVSQKQQQVKAGQQSPSDITIPKSLSQKVQQTAEEKVQSIEPPTTIKTAQQSQLPSDIKGPQFKIHQQLPPETQQQKEARQESQRISQFRRKHMIFPSKQSQEHNKQPIGSRVISQTIEGLQSRLHRSHPIEYVDLDESRLINATTASKKRQNFKLFRQWNERRSKQLQSYAYIVDNLFKGADNKIRQSFEHLEIYSTFFRQRGNQQERYSSTPIIDTGYSLNQNEIGSTAFSQCSEVMKIIGQFNLERCKKIQNFAYLIKKNIIADILQNHTTKSKQELSSLKQKIISVRNALNETQVIIQRKTVELSIFIDENPSPQVKNQDYYYSQISFLRTASQIVNIFRKYGELTYNFFDLAAQLQKQRIEKVKAAIEIYIQGLKQTYGFESSKQIEEKLGAHDPKVIQNIYNVSGLIDPKLQEYIKNEIQVEITEPLTAEELKTYLQKLTFRPYDNRLLTLKEFKTVNIHKDKANQTCNIVITVDKFLHIYLNTQSAHIYAKPSQSFRIDPNLKVFRQGSVLELVKSVEKKGVISYIIWQPPTVFKYIIQFAKDDAALQFEDCIKKLM